MAPAPCGATGSPAPNPPRPPPPIPHNVGTLPPDVRAPVLFARGLPPRVADVSAEAGSADDARARFARGRTLRDLVDPRDRTAFDHALAEGAPSFTVRLVLGEGAPLWYVGERRGSEARVEWLLRRSASEDDGGDPESFHRYQAFVERALDAFYIKDLDGQYLYINPAGARMLGAAVQDVVGHYDNDFFTAASVSELRAIDRKVMESGEPWTYQPRRDDFGHERHFFTRKYPYRDHRGRLAGVMGVSHDVTDWVHSEHERARLDRALHAILERSPDLIVVCRQSRVLFHNTAARTIVAAPHAEAFVAAPVERWLPEGGFDALENERFRHCDLRPWDGERVPVEATCLDLDWDGGPATLIIARDLREKQLLEERLRRSDRLAVLGTLAAGMAHEINSPLAYARLLLEEYDAELLAAGKGEHARRRITDAVEAVARAGEIVTNVRRFVRGEGSAGQKAELGRVLEQAAKISAPEWRFRATLDLRSEGAVWVRGSEGSLIQVFVNLLVNAARALPAGAPQEHRVEVRIDVEGEEVAVAVADDGPGLPKGIGDGPFVPFATTRGATGGTGLGLWMSSVLVEEAGGRLSLGRRAGGGARAVVRLQRVDAPEPPVERSAALPASDVKVPPQAKIMVLDDEAGIRRALGAVLRPLGAVHCFATLAEARGPLVEEPWDAILLDVMLPDGAGTDLLEWIRTERPELALRVVLMTGGAVGDAVAAAVDGAGVPVLQKPYGRAAVIDAVKACFARA